MLRRVAAAPCARTTLAARAAVPQRAMSMACVLPEEPEEQRRGQQPLSAGLRHPSNLQSALDRMQLPVFRARAEGIAVHEHRGFATDTAGHKSAEYTPGPIIGRMAVLAEVVVSKIFPAGFGWQGFSAIAEEMGLEADQLSFYFITGLGDFCGVLVGHTTFYAIKKALFDPSIKMSDTFQLGVWLASAAFMSGGAWQPAVNCFQTKGVYSDGILPFNNAVVATTIVCGSMFYVGLRLGRSIYQPIMPALPGPDYGNLRSDAQLSIAVGGATGCFVGTDTSYGAENWMTGLLGVGDDDAILTGMIKAGSSTALGFTAVQLVQNVTVPHGTCWLD
jgi:hypothetical protein